jgi:hypothetical protein
MLNPDNVDAFAFTVDLDASSEFELIDRDVMAQHTWVDAMSVNKWFYRGFLTASAVAEAWEIASDRLQEIGASVWANEAQRLAWLARSIDYAPSIRQPRRQSRERMLHWKRYSKIRYQGPIRDERPT